MSKPHNEAQIHVRNTTGKFRPGTTTPPAEAETNQLSPNEQTYLARGSNAPEPPPTPGLEPIDIVEVLSDTLHPDVADSPDA